MEKILIFGDVSAPPFINNLSAPVRAFQRVAEVKVIEPRFVEGFVPTGAARPAMVPEVSVRQALSEFDPTIVVCLGGGLFIPAALRQHFRKETVFAGFAFSDPLGLDASLKIARDFDLFYTQDPQTVDAYLSEGIKVGRCDPAIDAELFHPMEVQKVYDILFYGKWTPHRDSIIRTLATRYRVTLHAHRLERRWSIPALAPLNDPQSLCEAINKARLALEFAIMDDAPGRFKDTSRITNRTQFAAACGVPSLIDNFDRLAEFFEPGVEILVYNRPEEILDQVDTLIADEDRMREMGRRARLRVLKEQTWDVRVQAFLRDLENHRSSAGQEAGS